MSLLPKARMRGEVFVLLATFCWSTSGVLTRGLSISPILSNAMRSFIAIFMLLIYSKGRVKCNKSILCASVCVVGATTLFFIALSLTEAANAVVIQYTAPIFVLILTCIRNRQRPTAVQVGVVLTAFTGVAIVFSSDLAGGGLAGNLVALASGVALAGVFFANSQPGASPIDASILAFIFNSFTGLFFIDQIIVMTPGEWGRVLLLGLIQHGLAYVFFCTGVVRCSGFSSSLTGMLETVLVPLWVFLFFRELPSFLSIVGCSLVIGAVVVNVLADRQLQQRQEFSS